MSPELFGRNGKSVWAMGVQYRGGRCHRSREGTVDNRAHLNL